MWESLARFLRELLLILPNGVDQTLIMASSPTLVRLRNEMAAFVSRPMGDREADVPDSLSTVEAICCLLAEGYGAAVELRSGSTLELYLHAGSW